MLDTVQVSGVMMVNTTESGAIYPIVDLNHAVSGVILQGIRLERVRAHRRDFMEGAP